MPLFNAIVFDPDDLDEGFYAFDDMLGILQPKIKQVEIIPRLGLPGETLLNTGVRAVPSQLTTVRGVVDRAAALNFLDGYRDLIDGMPYELFQHDESFGFVRVQHLTALPLQPLAVSAGFLDSDATILQLVQWTLISTDPPPP